MRKRLLIRNNVDYHYEIIESVIHYCREILSLGRDVEFEIHLHLPNMPDSSFVSYITSKYPGLHLGQITDFDFYINCTVYDRDYKNMVKYPTNRKYIAHEITGNLLSNPNVYFLSPLSRRNVILADKLPFSHLKKTGDLPIYIIQGNLNENRRNLSLLKKILDSTYDKKFVIKLVGKGHLPHELIPYKDKIVLRNNLNFVDFHKEFLDAYCILPLITRNSHPQYYNTKLTSTINYARGYNLKCLIDQDLQCIYNLRNVAVFEDVNDIHTKFKETLNDFYNEQ